MKDPGPNASRMVIIISSGPRTGKTTARVAFARGLGSPGTSTSKVIAGVLEAERGWPPGTIVRARWADHEAFRDELREVGDRIGRGRRPALVRAIDAGFRVVDGCRRAAELDAGIRRARRLGLDVWVVWIGGRPASGTDNTEAVLLRERASIEIANRGTIDDLDHAIMQFLEDMGVRVPPPSADRAGRR